MDVVTYKENKTNIRTGYTEVVHHHTVKVGIDKPIFNPPFKRLLDMLNWFPKVLFQLTRTRPDLFGHGNVSKVVVIVINLRD